MERERVRLGGGGDDGGNRRVGDVVLTLILLSFPFFLPPSYQRSWSWMLIPFLIQVLIVLYFAASGGKKLSNYATKRQEQ